ncbi:MAG: hypothetical protein LKI03_05880 [Acetobacter indonesiensis]|nr:hypothetical protein [Acetobacter indonesiensis]MCI1546115.1 hypothetical protein [Acetobacter indonesiensis]MCI1765561.1 hypothetical protein [Acetobacter indonesiensis]
MIERETGATCRPSRLLLTAVSIGQAVYVGFLLWQLPADVHNGRWFSVGVQSALCLVFGLSAFLMARRALRWPGSSRNVIGKPPESGRRPSV